MKQSHAQLFEELKEGLEPEVVAYLRNAQGPVAVACSGGPDSVAAAIVAKIICDENTDSKNKTPVTLLHFDHRLRGWASKKDAEFVKNLAKEIGADFRLGVWDKDKPDKKNETTARGARMNFLHGWEHETIVLGHHADDAVETMLMRLARGATLEGLLAPHALNRVRQHVHVRPLINLRKKTIVEALKRCKIKYREDKTNAGGDYLRNRIRNKLLPLWHRIESRDVSEGILASRAHMAVHLEADRQLKPATNIEKEWQKRLERYQVNMVVGVTIFLPTGGWISATRVPCPTLGELKTESDSLRCVWLRDSKELMSVKSWTQGTFYRPAGGRNKKIKEILNENCGRVDPEIRTMWPLVSDRDGAPLWLPGVRITQKALVPGGATHAIRLNFCPPGGKVEE